MITTRVGRASAKVNSVFLPVTQVGMVVTVGAGAFKVGGNDYELLEDWTYTAVSDEAKTVFGNLASDVDGNVVLLVEEVSAATPLMFKWVGSGYTRIHELFRLVVPEGVIDLDATEVFVRHTGVPPEG